jgi:signal transduction histidine kinase
LQRSWNDKSPDWGSKLEKISQTLIEQIDHLSSIASAFSNFAEMPGTDNTRVDIISIIRNTISLFSNNEKISFILELNNNEYAFIYADESQFVRVFNNLVKNAIQSIPEDSEGVIRIDLNIVDEVVIVRIEDNGQGVPDELEDKLFQPNFTTKSSGMGLGLAIVKKIIEDAKGSIRYETTLGEGTTFIIELPEHTL